MQPRLKAESAMAEWMRHHGFPDADVTPGGADGGIDVVANRAIAQVKTHMKSVGRPDVQRLVGAAVDRQKTLLFFSHSGFSANASQYAEDAHVALFNFDLHGNVVPLNARAMAVAAWHDPAPGSPPSDAFDSAALEELLAQHAIRGANVASDLAGQPVEEPVSVFGCIGCLLSPVLLLLLANGGGALKSACLID